MKLKISFLGLLCAFFCATSAQEHPEIKTLAIGDKVPETAFTGLLDPNTGSLTQGKLSAYKGKILIIDFWATWCAPCVSMIPKMDSLQTAFKDQIRFLPVAYQSEAEIKAFDKRLALQRGSNNQLPQVVGDLTLSALFPHQALPHYVWISADGTVAAITDQHEVTASHINTLLKTGKLDLAVKQDERVAYDRNVPLFFDGAEDFDGPEFRFSGYREGVGKGVYKDVDFDLGGDFRRITVRNFTIPELFRIAYGKEINTTKLELSKPEEVIPQTDHGEAYTEWLKAGHAFCYELILPNDQAGTAYQLMRRQLSDKFPAYQASLEKRRVDCLALVRTSATDKLHTSGGQPSAMLDGFEGHFKSCYLAVFIARMQVLLQGNPLPLIDLTGYKEMADLDLSGDMRDLASVNAALARYDLQLVKKPADIELLVIRDQPAL